MGCATKPGVPSSPPPRGSHEAAPFPLARVQEGLASWYGPGFHGNRTSSGETYDMFQMTAAHRTLPLGTKLLVTNLENQRTVEVVVNDRGPFVKDRIIDLSYSAARVLGIVEPGTARVRLEIIEDPPGGPVADFSSKPVYSLQLGAFSEVERARGLQSEIEKLLGPGTARIEPARVGSQQLHRVRVGFFQDREEALAKAKELVSRGYVVLVVDAR